MTQSKFLLTLLVCTAISFSACSPVITTTASWANKEKAPAKPYKSVFIVVISSKMDVKSQMEDDLAAAAEKKGLKVYKSIDVFGPISTTEKAPLKDAITRKVAELGCESIFTVALIDEKSETKYVPGSTTVYAPYSRYGYYGSFGGYYNYGYATYSPGYYTTDKTYFIECNLFDAKTGDIMVSIQSKAENPPAIAKASKEYTASVVAEMQKLNLFSKTK